MPDTLFTNARLILDGSTEHTASSDVLVKGGFIHALSPEPLDRGSASSSMSAGARSCRVSSTPTVTSQVGP